MFLFAIGRLYSPSELRNYDRSGFHNHTNPVETTPPRIDSSQQTGTTTDTSYNIVNLNQEYFHQQLVKYVDIMYQQNKTIWPRSNKLKPKYI